MNSVEEVVRACWDHYDYEDAIFVSELFYAQKRSDRALFLLASSYFRSGQVSAAYHLLQAHRRESPTTRFLFAKCCEKLEKYAEAADALIGDVDTVDASLFGQSIGFAHNLLGNVYKELNQVRLATKEHVKALQHVPFLFSSLQNLSELHPVANVDAVQELITDKDLGGDSDIQNPTTVVEQDDDSLNSLNSSVPLRRFGEDGGDKFDTLPQAPKKNIARVHRASQEQIGSRSQSHLNVLNARNSNQTFIQPRRNRRLFQNCENSVRRDMARSSFRRTRMRKLDGEKIPLSSTPEERSTPLRKRCIDLEMLNSSENDDPGIMHKFKAHFRDICEVELALNRFDCAKAVQLWSQLPSDLRQSPYGLTAVAKAYYEQSNYEKAVEYFRSCHQRYRYYVKGSDLFSSTLWHLQLESELSYLAEDLLEKFRYAPESWCAAGNCFSLQKDQESSLRFFKRAIQVQPKFCYAYNLLGLELCSAEKFEEAMQSFRRALQLKPRNYNAWYGLGLTYYKLEDLQQAQIHFQRALDFNPQNAILMCHLSLVKHASSDTEGAMKLLDSAVSLVPTNPLCRFHRAKLLVVQEKYSEALEELEKLKRFAPKEPMVYFLAGKVHKRLGQPHFALVNFSWGSDLDPREEHLATGVIDRKCDDDDTITVLAATDAEEMAEITQVENDNSA